MIISIEEAAAHYGVQRKSIVQAARRHSLARQAILRNPAGVAVHVDTDIFDLWWNQERDERMDKVRRGLS